MTSMGKRGRVGKGSRKRERHANSKKGGREGGRE